MWRLTPVSPSSTHIDIHFVFLYVINHFSVVYQFEVMQISSIITSSPMIPWRSTAKTAKEAEAAPESSRSLKWGILNHLNVRPYTLFHLHVFKAYKWTNGPTIEILTTMCLLGIEMQRTPKCLGQHMVQQNVAELQQLRSVFWFETLLHLWNWRHLEHISETFWKIRIGPLTCSIENYQYRIIVTQTNPTLTVIHQALAFATLGSLSVKGLIVCLKWS